MSAVPDIPRNWALVLLLIAVVGGGLLRIPGLEVAPPGFYHDEAYYAIDGRWISEGNFPIFLEANNGRQPLFSYTQAPFIALLGSTVTAARLPAALWGLLFIPVAYLLVLEALHGRPWARLGAAGAALVIAGLLYAVFFSRYGLRVSTVPVTFGLAAWLTLRSLRVGSTRSWLLTGLAIGACFYTYLSGYLVPLVVALTVIPVALVREDRSPIRGLVLAGGAALVIAAPLLAYFALNPDQLLTRPSQVSVTALATTPLELVTMVAGNVAQYIGMYVWAGDTNWRHNIAGAPALDPVTIVLVVVGIGGLVLGVARRSAAWLALVTFVVMLLPGALTYENLPQAFRVFAALVALAIAVGAGIAALARVIGRLSPRVSAPVATAAIVVVALAVTGFTGWRYFVVYAPNPETVAAFGTEYADLARDLRGREGPAVLIGVPPSNQAVFEYLAPNALPGIRWLTDLGQLPLDSVPPGTPLAFLQTAVPLANLAAGVTGQVVESAADGRLAVVDAAPVRPGPSVVTFDDGTSLKAVGTGSLDVGGAVAAGWICEPCPQRPTWSYVAVTDEAGRDVAARFGDLGSMAMETTFAYTNVYFDPVLPPGRYTVWLGLSDQDGLVTRNPVDGDLERRANLVRAGAFAVTPSTFPQTGGPIAMAPPLLPRNLGGLLVAGHRIEAASLVEATTLRAPLFLRRTGPVADLTLEWRLVTAGGQVIFSQPYEPFDGRFPFGDWEPRTIYGDRIELALPRRLPQGALELRLHDARTNEFTTLARLPAETRQRDSARPDLAAYRPIGAVFNQEVELVAARIAGSNAATIVTPPTTLPIGVAWRAVTDPTSSLRMFVHVLDASGQLVAQADRLPRGGAEPTTSWVAGQWITDDFGLDVSGLGPGRYQLVTGMSDLGRGRRADITTPAGSGSTIPLGTLEIR